MSGRRLTVTPADLEWLSMTFAEVSDALDALDDIDTAPPGSFGAVTHSALIEDRADQFASTGVVDRLRSSRADADDIAELLRHAAPAYTDQDATSGRAVSRAVDGAPGATVID